MFLIIGSDKSLTEKIIKSITYKLNSAVNTDSPTTVSEAPYLFVREAKSPVDLMWPISCTIEFQNWTRISPL
jgi:hypothetical protein